MAALVETSGLTKHFRAARGMTEVLRGARPVVRAVDGVEFAIQRCRAETLPTETAGADHTAACWRLAEAPALRERARKVETWQRS